MKYGLIGEKLGHSFSKEIHEKLGDYKYELKEIARKDLDSFMTQKDFNAINVTIPYKKNVIKYLDYVDENALNINAVNTIVKKDNKLYGYNTDYLGMISLIKKIDLTKDFIDSKVLILGTGGTSNTAYAVAKSLGAKEIIKVSRNKKDNVISYSEAIKQIDTKIIINTTPVGMYPNNEDCPIDLENFINLKGIIDVIYNPLRTNLITNAKKMNLKCGGGLYMLVAQAVYAYEKFMDKEVDEKLIDEIYEEILASKENIILMGMPGAGKSTIGNELKKISERKLIDSDEVIIEEYGVISKIFDKYGEKGFRDIETEVIKKISKENSLIISLGGGTILRKENVDHLKMNGKIYFIDRDLDLLVPTSDRPLSSNYEDLKKRYIERYDIYRENADVTIKNNDSLEKTINSIKKEAKI